MKVRVGRALGFTLLCACGGGIGGICYVVVRYLIGSQSELPRLFAGAYLAGGFIVGLLPGAATAGIFLLLVTTVGKFLPSGIRLVLSAMLSGVVGTILTCVVFAALNEQFDRFWFIGVFSIASALFLIASGLWLFRPESGATRHV